MPDDLSAAAAPRLKAADVTRGNPAATDRTSAAPGAATLVDAHVHIHSHFDPRAFLAATLTNFRAAAAATGHAEAAFAVLLTERAGTDAFAALAARPPEGWTAEPTGEAVSLRLQAPDGGVLVLISGRQVVTREGLEVLALGTRQTFADGEPIAAILAEATAAGALPVLPWGFGKWAGRRGRIVTALARDPGVPLLLFGDNGGRPALVPRPSLLAQAERQGRIVLSGTDPLPLVAETGKAGRFGSIVPVSLDPGTPFARLAAWLRRADRSPAPYGPLERADIFVRRQAALRLGR